MSIRIGINGFGRIGRCVARQIIESHHDIEIIAINDLTDIESLGYLLEFDSVHRRFRYRVETKEKSIEVANRSIKVIAEKDPKLLPWGDLGVDVVLECTGRFRTQKDAEQHLHAGAKRVIISAPPHGQVDGIFCVGINEKTYDPQKHKVISNASCTTNCLAPLLKVLQASFGIQKAHMITVHSYTNDQSIVDAPHKNDPRRGRAAALSMIPTTSGVTQALSEVLPFMNGRFGGSSIRVPTADVSIVSLTTLVERSTNIKEVNEAIRQAADHDLKGILSIEDRPLVSVDFIGNTHSSIVDPAFTDVIDGDLVEIQSWYDNEWGFSARMVDLVRVLSSSNG